MIHVITWDWKEQPNWHKIMESVDKVQAKRNGLKFIPIEIGSDEYAVAIGDITLNEQSAYEAYKTYIGN